MELTYTGNSAACFYSWRCIKALTNWEILSVAGVWSCLWHSLTFGFSYYSDIQSWMVSLFDICRAVDVSVAPGHVHPCQTVIEQVHHIVDYFLSVLTNWFLSVRDHEWVLPHLLKLRVRNSHTEIWKQKNRRCHAGQVEVIIMSVGYYMLNFLGNVTVENGKSVYNSLSYNEKNRMSCFFSNTVYKVKNGIIGCNYYYV